MRDLIVVGAGQAFQEHYAKILAEMPDLRVVGIVDKETKLISKEMFGGVWERAEVGEIPGEAIRPDVAVIILTPDHYPVIVELARLGFKFIMVEKPLVSRDEEVSRVVELVDEQQLRLYAIDFYIPKLFPLSVASGKLEEGDPRFKFVNSTGIISPAHFLGNIEGIGVQVIEAGNFCLPDLEKRPWLERDLAIGGMLRDLGTHALAPLVAAGLLTDAAQVHDVKLARISSNRSSLVPIHDYSEVELYVSALLTTEDDIPIHVAFGKVPFRGGIWSLEIRGDQGMFYAGLRTGQPAVLVSNKGASVFLSLAASTYRIVIEEALMYFRGELPGFDGNVGAFYVSMEILRKMREQYFSSR